MPVREIENIEIPGFTNYYLYAFDYTPGFADSPGSIQVEFLSKDGVYDDIDISVHSYLPVYVKNSEGLKSSIGHFTAVSYEISENDRAKTMSVRFVDKSVELDRHFIALRGQLGYDSIAHNKLPIKEKARIKGVSAPGGRIIWVGESDETCKESAFGDMLGTDPCDPCAERISNPQLRQLDCNQYYLENRRVYNYNTRELLSALRAQTGVGFGEIGASENHKFDFTGSARDVLNNIAAELGLTFFYDPILNLVTFIDIKVGIAINTKDIEIEQNKGKILSRTRAKSRENSRDVWGVASFSRDSEEKRYACGINSCRKLRMQPFTLSDILGSPAHFSEESASVGFEKLEFYSIINARIGKQFRDLAVWTHEYGFNDPITLEAEINKKLLKLNGMKVKAVYHQGSSSAKNRFVHRLLLRLNTSKDFERIKDRADKKNVYFFLAEVDETYDDKITELERSIASEFLGKFWIKYFKENWKRLSYSYIAPDGSVTYYDYNNPINLPFSDIVYKAYSSLKASPLLSGKTAIVSGETPKTLAARDTFFLMERNASYWPDALSEENMEKINSAITKYLFREISIPVELSIKLSKDSSIEGPYDENTYKMFMVPGPTEKLRFDVRIEDEQDHPGEKENVSIRVDACGKRTNYGLRSAKSKKFNISFDGVNFSLYMPVQSYVKSSSHAGYNVLVERAGEDANYTMPKAEVFASGQIGYSSSLGIDLNFYNATTNDLSLLSRSASESPCTANLTAIEGLLQPILKTLTYRVGLEETRSYLLEGFPSNFFNAGDGLKSMSISVGESGITSSLSFSNTAPFKASVDDFFKKLKYTRFSQLTKPYPSGTRDNTNSQDLPSF